MTDAAAVVVEYYVTRSGVVHHPACGQLSRADEAVVWDPDWMEEYDRPCQRCIPDGLPT